MMKSVCGATVCLGIAFD